MKAVVFRDVEQVEVAEVPDPRVEEPDDAVVRVTTAAICGSDLPFFHGKAPLSPGDTVGHEGVGVVDQVGPGVTRFKAGDRVVISFDIACGECSVIEAVGTSRSFESAVEVVRCGGTVVVLGMYTVEQVEIPLGVYWARTLDVRFSGVTPIHAWWERSMAAVVDGTIDPLPIVSHTVPLADAVEGYRLFASRQATKVLLKP